MNVSLTPELEKYIQAKVESGRYTSASEVVREALRLLEQTEQERKQSLKEFQAELDRRIASLDRGEGIDGEKFFEDLKKRTKALQRKSA
jgi:antitoxin ParD1/3/4